MRRTALAFLFVGSALSSTTHAQSWIWDADPGDDEQLWFRRAVEIDAGCTARVYISCDNRFTLFLNGTELRRGDQWERPRRVECTDQLLVGRNVLAVRAVNEGGPAGLCVRMAVATGDGRRAQDGAQVVSDGSWRVAPASADASDIGPAAPDYDDSQWDFATVHGELGSGTWSRVAPTQFGLTPPPPEPQPVRVDSSVEVVPGFRVERLFDAPAGTSWVALAVRDDGSIYAADQFGTGISRIRPARLGDATAQTEVEPLDQLDVGGIHGMLWAFDSLYVVGNGPSGLYRFRDSDADGEIDRSELLRSLKGGGEHGPHSVLPTPDGQNLIVIAGNHTELTELSGSRLPTNWGEDHLLPRRPDPRGHADGRMAPGGWICRVTPDGKDWEFLGGGLRNAFDVAFHHGELFTYDADMEWDLGLPWYRPTRICQVVSGADFGWRHGSGKWPASYPDSVPAALEIGPGSPTGLLSGRGFAAPARYSEAMFALDWTFGTIWSVHLRPEGAGFRGECKEFITGQPLAVTDAVIGTDRAMYFATGGRRTRSSLYRVVATGNGADAAPAVTAIAPTPARATARELESFHGRIDPKAVDTAWPQLNHRDRLVRYAARIAVESQPVAEWRQRAVAATEDRTAIEALIALARQGEAADAEPLLERLARCPFDGADANRINLLRTYGLAFTRLGKPSEAQRIRALAQLDRHFPTGSAAVDTELAQVLVYLDAPAIIDRVLEAMAAAPPTIAPDWSRIAMRNKTYGDPIRRMVESMPPIQQIRYAEILSGAEFGWTLEQRRTLLEFFPRAAEFSGGTNYSRHLVSIRGAAMATYSTAEREALADLTGESLDPAPAFDITAPIGPARSWTLATAQAVIGSAPLRNRNFQAGRNLYHAAQCAACHRLRGEGRDIGPDLTSVAGRFSVSDLLEATISPSTVVSDQYAAMVVTGTDGSAAIGRIAETDGTITVYPMTVVDVPPTTFDRDKIASMEPLGVSPMPAGLIDPLNDEELRDLIAYLLARGNPNDPAFGR